MFALIDANSFYASAETVFRPELRGQKVVVLTNNDGCVAAASKPAIAAGIKKFKPYFQQKSLIEEQGMSVFSSNYTLYADLSAKMMATILRFGDGHIYSIDEAFLDLRQQSRLIANMNEYCKQIRQAVWRETRLPVCIGVGPTPTLAKLANRTAKNKTIDNSGVFVIDNEQARHHCLNQPVGEVWGVGRRLEKRLSFIDITTALELSKLQPSQARTTWSVELERTVRELNGELCKHWDEVRADKKQIFSTRTMGKAVVSLDELIESLSMHASIAAKKLRSQSSLVKTVYIFANNNDFQCQAQGIKGTHTFVEPTNDTIVISKAIREVVRHLYREDISYKKVGVGLIELVSSEQYQLSLFHKDETNQPLMNTMDKLNNFYGKNTLFLANQGIKQEWSMKRNFLSPAYTTCWKHLPKISC